MAITSINDLMKYAEGTEVELPGFVEGEPFIAKLRRPSMLALAKEGKIPNTLLSVAGKLFNTGTKEVQNSEDVKAMSDIFIAIAKASLVSPSWDELQKIGLSLTDGQLFYIYNYSQTGVDALRRFRSKQDIVVDDKSGQQASRPAK